MQQTFAFSRFVPALLLWPLALGAGCSSDRFGSDLHADPARCGMASFTWLDDDRLGEVLERQPLHEYPVDFLAPALAALDDVAAVRRKPTHDVYLDRFRYTTQDQGQLVEATGLYAFPVGPGPFPLILYTHGTSGYSDECAPSAHGGNPLHPDVLVPALLASFGYVVVGPDYIGMKSLGDPSGAVHPYVVAQPTAIAALDAARAAHRLAASDKMELGPLLVAGASQGGHAAAFTVRYQPHYAAELDVKAAVYLVPPLDLLGHASLVLDGALTPVDLGNMSVLMAGHDSWYRASPGGLADVMQPEWAARVEEHMSSQCALLEIDAPIEQVYRPEALSAISPNAFDLEPWGCMLRESSLVNTSVPRLDDVPALVVLGEVDQLVDPTIERGGFGKLCDQGMQLQLLECAGRDHGGAVAASLDDVLDFIEARLQGVPMEDVCVDAPIRTCSSDPAAAPAPAAP